jgi:hypothetical protein
MPNGHLEDRHARDRAIMVAHHLEARGIADPLVLAAMGEVPREALVFEPLKEFAYEDFGAAHRGGPDYLAAVYRGPYDRAARACARRRYSFPHSKRASRALAGPVSGEGILGACFWGRDIFMRYYYGVVLISLGIVVMVLNPFNKLDAYLRGAPNTVLTATLLGLATLTALVAFWARPSLKALVILWILAP